MPDLRTEPASVPGSAPDPGSTVLVIEDDPGAVRLLRTYLEGEGYRVELATDGEAGIAAARANVPDAIILDVLLPGIDGWEVLRRLKGDPALRDVPVVVVTVVDERNVAMNLGAVDYFLKPVRREALLARLATYTFTTKVKERNVRVLVIDDDLAARDLVANALRPEGFEVVSAASGKEGLDLALRDPPDLVICDLLMPDMDGFEVVEPAGGERHAQGRPDPDPDRPGPHPRRPRAPEWQGRCRDGQGRRPAARARHLAPPCGCCLGTAERHRGCLRPTLRLARTMRQRAAWTGCLVGSSRTDTTCVSRGSSWSHSWRRVTTATAVEAAPATKRLRARHQRRRPTPRHGCGHR